MGSLSRKKQELIAIIAFMFIPVLTLVVFTYYPACLLIYNSLTNWPGVGPKQFIGLTNYKQLFLNPSTFKILLNNFTYMIVGYIEIFMALYFAVILNIKFKGRNFFKTLIFMPYIINSIAVAFMMTFVFDNSNGALNVFLRSIGASSPPNWVGSPSLVNYTFAFMSLWKYLGMTTVLFLAALQSIDTDLYEAASLDGADAWHTFWRITMPGIWGMFQLTLFMNLSGAIGAFEFVFAIYPSGGSPMGMADTFVIKTINMAFKYNNFGMASAMGVSLMALTAALVLAQFKFFARKVN